MAQSRIVKKKRKEKKSLETITGNRNILTQKVFILRCFENLEVDK